MKLKSIVIATFCLTSLTANSATSDVPSFTVTRTVDASQSIFLVDYKGDKISDIKIVIKDDREREVLTKLIKGKKDFLLPINFSSVDEGSYTILIDNGSKKLTQTLTYTNEKAPTYSHVVSLGDNRYLFTSSHAGSEKITIRIYNAEGSLIYDKGEVIKGDFAMLLNLKNVVGTPVFEVVENSGTYIMVLRNPTVVTVEK